MLNAEKYRTEIQKIRKDDKNVGICRKTGELFACDPYDTDDIPCKDCLMHDGIRECKNAVVDWLLNECKEKIKLTRFEYVFLNVAKEKWSYIYRTDKHSDNDNYFIVRHSEPKFLNGKYVPEHSARGFSTDFFGDDFLSFIKKGCKNSYKIQDILNNCVVTDDESEREKKRLGITEPNYKEKFDEACSMLATICRDKEGCFDSFQCPFKDKYGFCDTECEKKEKWKVLLLEGDEENA